MQLIFFIYVYIVYGTYYRLNDGEMLAFQTPYLIQHQDSDQDLFIQYENYVLVRDQTLEVSEIIYISEGMDNQMKEQQIYLLIRQPIYQIKQLIATNPLKIDLITILELPFIKGLEFYSFIFFDEDTLIIDCRFNLISKNCFYEYKLSSRMLTLRQLDSFPQNNFNFRQITLYRDTDLLIRIQDKFLESYNLSNFKQQNTTILEHKIINSFAIQNQVLLFSQSELYRLNYDYGIEIVKFNQFGQMYQIHANFIYFCGIQLNQCDKLHEINIEQYLFIQMWNSYILIYNHETIYVYNGQQLTIREVVKNFKRILVILFYNEIYVFSQNFVSVYQLQNRNMIVIQAQNSYIINMQKYNLTYNITNKDKQKIIQIQNQFIRQDIIANFWYKPTENFLGGDIQYSFRLLNQEYQKLIVFRQRIFQELFQLDCSFIQILQIDFNKVVKFVCQQSNLSLQLFEGNSQLLNELYCKSQIQFPYRLKQLYDIVTYENFTFYITYDQKSYTNQTQILICDGFLQFYNLKHAVCLYPDRVYLKENNGLYDIETQLGTYVKFKFFIGKLYFLSYYNSYIKVQKFVFSSKSYIVNTIFIDNYIDSILFENYLIIITRDKITRYYYITPYRLIYSGEFELFGRVIQNNATIIQDNSNFYIQQNGLVLAFNIFKTYFIEQFPLEHPIIAACDDLIYYRNVMIQSIRYEAQFMVETTKHNWLVYSFQFEVCASNKFDKECLIQNQTVYQSYNTLQPQKNINLYYQKGQKEINIEQLRLIGSFTKVQIKNNTNVLIMKNLHPISNIVRQIQILSLFYEQNLFYIVYYNQLEVINLFTQNKISISLKLERFKNIFKYGQYIVINCLQLFYFIQCSIECNVVYQIQSTNKGFKYKIFENFIIGYDNQQYSLFQFDFDQLTLIEKNTVEIYNNLIDFYFNDQLIIAYVDFHQKIYIQYGSILQQFQLQEIFSGFNMEESFTAIYYIKIISADIKILIFTKYQGNLLFQFNLNGSYRLISLLAIYPNLTIKKDWIFINNQIITVISMTQNNNLLIYQFNQQDQQQVIDCNLVNIPGSIFIQSIYFFIDNGRNILSIKSDFGIYNFYYYHKIKLISQNQFQDETISLELINPQSSLEIQLVLRQESDIGYLNILYFMLFVLFLLVLTFIIKRSLILRKYYHE